VRLRTIAAVKPILVQGRPLAGGHLPAVCAPLVASDRASLLAEAAAVAAKRPDLIEWRVDFFQGHERAQEMAALSRELRDTTGLPILFTHRSAREGGQPSPLDAPGLLALYRAVCEAGAVDLLDVEAATGAAHVDAVRAAAGPRGIALVLSFHDFNATPSAEVLAQHFERAHRLGADVAKIAVMPRSTADVLVLLQATYAASQSLPIPVASMAMGGLGAVTRLCGGQFGSALTFAVGQAASAPGQMPIEALRTGLAVLRDAGGSAG
jgi:3-dehydroquinate dehydratase-1